jgi:sugar lactone lactonase YvrE
MENTMIRPFLLALLVVVAPMAAAVADTVYFVSRSTGSLYTFDSGGGAIATLTGTNTFPDASALAIGTDGNLYIGDSTGGGSIKRYVTATGSVSAARSIPGRSPSQPTAPCSWAATPPSHFSLAGSPLGQAVRCWA